MEMKVDNKVRRKGGRRRTKRNKSEYSQIRKEKVFHSMCDVIILSFDFFFSIVLVLFGYIYQY
jgi:hypothetical protein